MQYICIHTNIHKEIKIDNKVFLFFILLTQQQRFIVLNFLPTLISNDCVYCVVKIGMYQN